AFANPSFCSSEKRSSSACFFCSSICCAVSAMDSPKLQVQSSRSKVQSGKQECKVELTSTLNFGLGTDSVDSAHFRIADGIEKILGIGRIELKAAGDAHEAAREPRRLAPRQLHVHDARRLGHLAVPAADRKFDEHEAVGLGVVAQGLHEAAKHHELAVQFLQILGERR